jgi:hypothetical protein
MLEITSDPARLEQAKKFVNGGLADGTFKPLIAETSLTPVFAHCRALVAIALGVPRTNFPSLIMTIRRDLACWLEGSR